MTINVFEEFKTEREFARWVGKQAGENRRLAFEGRDIIDKRSLQRETDLFSTLTKAWKPMRALRRQSKDYRLIVGIDRKGYHRITITFPIPKDALDKALRHREEVVKGLGRWGELCYTLAESLYDTYKETLDGLLPFANRVLDDSYRRYEPYRNDAYVRQSQITCFV